MRLPIIKYCERLTIADHIEIFHDRFRDVLRQGDADRLKQLYRLLTRVKNGLAPCYDAFEKHVLHRGLEAVDGVATPNRDVGIDGNENTSIADPTAFAQALASVMKQYHELVNDAFTGDQGFARALDRAFGQCLNWNSVCHYDTDAAELLARHVEMLLLASSRIQDSDEGTPDEFGDVVFDFRRSISFEMLTLL